ncbi:MAG: LUD domain-containing protein [Anaeromyxobacter sp.]
MAADPKAGRAAILAALRAAAPADPGLPGPIEVAPPRWPDHPARFAEAVVAVGGSVERVRDGAALATAVQVLAADLGARRIVSEVPAVKGTEPLAALADPHLLDGVDLAVLPGAFAVAETGAVWLPAGKLPHRATFVAVEHLALVVPADALVNDMHEAYARLGVLGAFAGPGFGVFVSGPSKTADIEQALVLGAHGARTCRVFLVG